MVFFERARRLGGHSNTVEVPTTDGYIDTGFIVYNERTYPNLVRLLDTLGVRTQPSDMSFSLSVEDGLEYGGSLTGLLTQPSRLLPARYRHMIGDIIRFRSAVDDVDSLDENLTLGRYLGDRAFSEGFVSDHAVPVAAAIWSARPDEILEFPAATMMRFLANHGLVKLTDRPQWRTVSGGSQRYVERIADHLGEAVRLDQRVRRIHRFVDHVEVETERGSGTFRSCRARYRVFYFFADIDELEDLSRQLRWFSHNRFNLFSLSDSDHGSDDGTSCVRGSTASSTRRVSTSTAAA